MEHTVGNTGNAPVTFCEETEPVTDSYANFAMSEVVDRVYKRAKRERLAVVAYDVHKLDVVVGTFTIKIEAFCYPYVLPL